MAEALDTTDPRSIQQWVEKRAGYPSTVRDTGRDDGPGNLRIDFDPPDAAPQRISWDAFFAKFGEAGLAFLCQEQTADGSVSRFQTALGGGLVPRRSVSVQ